MNKEYVVNKKKASISNEKGELKIREYTLNFEKILEKENEIELIENQLEDIKNEVNSFKKMRESKKRNIEEIIGGIITGIGLLLLFNHTFGQGTTIGMAIGKVGTIVSISTITLVFSFKTTNHFSSLFYKKEIEQNEFQIPFLQKNLDRAKQELQHLQERDISMKNIDKPKVMYVQGKEKLQSLKKYFECLKSYGAELKHQANLYVHGFWEEKEKEKIARNGIDTELFASYLNEYNTRKLMKRNKVS